MGIIRSAMSNKPILVALLGWVLLIVEWAIWIFIVPHGSGSIPEIGYWGFFIYFGFFLSGYFLSACLLTFLPLYLHSSRHFIRIGRPAFIIIGNLLFSVSAIPVGFLIYHDHFTDILGVSLFLLCPGFLCIYLLPYERDPSA